MLERGNVKWIFLPALVKNVKQAEYPSEVCMIGWFSNVIHQNWERQTLAYTQLRGLSKVVENWRLFVFCIDPCNSWVVKWKTEGFFV